MSVDEGKLLLIQNLASNQITQLKAKMDQLLMIHNQCRGIGLNATGEKPTSMLTQEPLNEALRLQIFNDIVKAGIRLGIIEK